MRDEFELIDYLKELFSEHAILVLVGATVFVVSFALYQLWAIRRALHRIEIILLQQAVREVDRILRPR